MRNRTIILAASCAAVTLGATGLTVAHASPQTAQSCGTNSFCVFADSNFGGGEIPTPASRGALSPNDEASSVQNNSSTKTLCLYDDQAIGGGSDLIATIAPKQSIPDLGGGNDRADRYKVTTTGGCTREF